MRDQRGKISHKAAGLSLLTAYQISHFQTLFKEPKQLSHDFWVLWCSVFGPLHKSPWFDPKKLHGTVKALFNCWMMREFISSLHPAQITSSIGSTQPISCNRDLRMFPSGKDKATNPFAHKRNWNCNPMLKDKYSVSTVNDLLQADWSHRAFHRAYPSLSQFRKRCPGPGEVAGSSLVSVCVLWLDGSPSVYLVPLITPNHHPICPLLSCVFRSHLTIAALCPLLSCFFSSCPDLFSQRRRLWHGHCAT